MRRKTKLTKEFVRGLNTAQLANDRFNFEASLPECKVCQSNKSVVLFGHNRNHIQRYRCKRCQKVFLANDNLPQMRFSARQIGDALGQYYGGMSLKELKRQFEQQHQVSLSRSSFDRWRIRFSKIAVDEAKRYHPKVGDTWLADECVLKIGGNKVWYWDIIDSDTRFLLATYLSPTRTIKDAQQLMEKASITAGKAPKVILTDSLAAYIDGIELTFGAETKHIQSHPFTTADFSTNKIERFHSTLRTREDIMRGLKSLPTAQALLDGWLIHYNFFRAHEGLDDVTPAEAAEVRYPFKDWLEVVQSQEAGAAPVVDMLDAPLEQPNQWKQPAHKAPASPRKRRTRRAHSKPNITTTVKMMRPK